MAEPLKAFFSPSLVKRLAGDIKAVYPGFAHRRFVADATAGLDDLELMARGAHIMRAMAAHLPPDYPAALDVLMRSLGVRQRQTASGGGMAPFFYLPHTMFVAEHGLAHFDLSMEAQRELTKRFTAEYSIRPFIAKDPERVMRILRQWARDPDEHVRRLVSEGTRLRLPWGRRVAWLDAHPERVIDLLNLLKDDPSEMVRRSVANNLNDAGRVRPDLLIETASAWLRDATPERSALVRHALRALVKRGDARALTLLGFGRKAAVVLDRARFEPRRVRIGGQVAMRFTLRSTSRVPQDLLVDAVVHFARPRGAAARVFKLRRVTLAPGDAVELTKSLSLAVHTTRVPRPGRHLVNLLVNGTPIPAGSFDVAGGDPRERK